MKSVLVKRVFSFILAILLVAGNVMPVLAEGSVSGNTVAEVTVEETTEAMEEESVVLEESMKQITEETSSVESTTEESAEETTEVSTEEVAEETTEDSVSENEIPEDESSVSVNEIIEEVPLAGALPVSLAPVNVSGITITVSGPASAFAEGTTVSAIEVEPAEVVIAAAEESEQAEVKRYKAFDINLVCNGEVVQPLNGEEITVNFEGDLLIPDTENKEEVVVYHVDDSEKITKMEAEVATVETEEAAEVETVEMTTTHFSTYVVMVTGDSGDVDVTINHYLEDGSRLFVAQEMKVERGGSVADFVKDEADFSVSKIVVDGTEYVPEKEGDYSYTADTYEETVVIDVYYSPLEKTVADVPVTVIDYDDYVDYGNEGGGSAYRENSINYYKNYPSYEPLTYQEALAYAYEQDPYWGPYFTWEDFIRNYNWMDIRKDKENWSKRYATKGAYLNYVLNETNTEGMVVNANDYRTADQVIKGLLLGLSGEKYSEVNFKYEDPGFFTTELNQYGTKRIYDNYSLGFTRNGLEYTLQDVRKDNGVVWTELNHFFPLSNSSDEINEYFSMRYDFTFKIGDYVGDMTYTFSGDDDLWVCLDGEVILDLGGIHERVEGSVNVWEKLIGKANPSYEDKVAFLAGGAGNEVHTITVLYMERGGSKSNCEMHFMMPNIVPSDPVTSNAPKADIELVKKDSITKETIESVGFTLYADAACQIIKGYEQRTDENGKVSFKDLRVGTYYLKETSYDTSKYQVNENIYVVTVTANGENATAVIQNLSEKEGTAYVVYNTPILKTDLEFVKVDSKDSAITLAGAEFELTSTADETFKKTATSDENGKILFEEIEAGVYILKETKAPEGYKLPSDEILTITVEVKDGKLEYAVSGNENNIWLQYGKDGENHLIKNIEARGSLKITKTVNRVDSEHGAAAFTFKITCADGSVLYRTITFEGDTDTDVTKSVTVADLPVGECNVEELTALRYECVSDVSQTKIIKVKETTEYSFHNEKDYDKNYSHTDVVVNKVVFNEDGSVTMTQEKSSTSEVVTE